MVEGPFNYDTFKREEWAGIVTPQSKNGKSHITPSILENIKAFNDHISMNDVTMIYDPLVHYIQLRYDQYQRDLKERQTFLGADAKGSPFVIGIAGSVAVGKSTTARLLQLMLQVAYGDDQVALATTDGFLLPNEILKKRGLFDRKGFPESYDMPALLQFMLHIKDGREIIKAPRYSHDTSDVLKGEFDQFSRPKIFIIEGINTLQTAPDSPVYVSDFFDMSIYVDAQTKLIKHWYLDRFVALLNQTKDQQDPSNYFYKWTQLPFKEALKVASDVWNTVNLPNLEEYILPTRERADLILHKVRGHSIDQVWLRKF